MKLIISILAILLVACEGTTDMGTQPSSVIDNPAVIDTVSRKDTTVVVGDTLKYNKTVIVVDTIRKVLQDTIRNTTVKLDTTNSTTVKFDTTRSVITIVDTIYNRYNKFDTVHVVISDTVITDLSNLPQRVSFTDARDGRIYGSVKFGKLYWMTSPLAYNPSGAYTVRPDGAVLYPRNGADVCPSGWRLPTSIEFSNAYSSDVSLIDSIGVMDYISYTSPDDRSTLGITPYPFPSNISVIEVQDKNGLPRDGLQLLIGPYGVIMDPKYVIIQDNVGEYTRWCVKDIN
jgi:hypothetical protein